MNKTVYILIAAYNEEYDLPGLLDDISLQNWQWNYKIIIVNDGSTDKTRDVIENYSKILPITLINHTKNLGLGRALNNGVNLILKEIKENDLLITLDADRTHDPELIPHLIDKINTGLDLVIASRFCGGGKQIGLSLYRKLISKTASLFLKIIWNIKNVVDYTSGYRIYSGNLIIGLSSVYKGNIVKESGFSATVELLLKSSRITDKISEIPLCLHYEKKTGPSKMKVFKTIIQYMFMISKLTLTRK